MDTFAGLEYSSRDAVIVIDVDPQYPPKLAGEMVAQSREGHAVVSPRRRHRTEVRGPAEIDR